MKNNNHKVNLFVIGVNKAGSSWLYYLLNKHPQIFMSEIKELYYFGNEYPENMDGYHQNFDFATDYNYYGEATPTYYRNIDIANEIRRYNPKAKILIILRDPIKRTLSQFYFHKQLNIIPENIDFEKALLKDRNLLIDSHYENYIPKWLKIFGPDNFKILSLEGFRNYPQNNWQNLLNFLEIDYIDMPEVTNTYENATGSYLFRLIYKLTIRPIKKISPTAYRKLLKCKILRQIKIILLNILGKAQKRELKESTMNTLKLEFKPTYEYLNSLGYGDIYEKERTE